MVVTFFPFSPQHKVEANEHEEHASKAALNINFQYCHIYIFTKIELYDYFLILPSSINGVSNGGHRENDRTDSTNGAEGGNKDWPSFLHCPSAETYTYSIYKSTLCIPMITKVWIIQNH